MSQRSYTLGSGYMVKFWSFFGYMVFGNMVISAIQSIFAWINVDHITGIDCILWFNHRAERKRSDLTLLNTEMSLHFSGRWLVTQQGIWHPEIFWSAILTPIQNRQQFLIVLRIGLKTPHFHPKQAGVMDCFPPRSATPNALLSGQTKIIHVMAKTFR